MGGSREGSDFQNLHRNKRSMVLNLKDPDGVAIFRKMAETADVVVENYRPDVKIPPSASITRPSAPRTRGLSMPRFPASARTARWRGARALTRSPRAWAG